MKPGDVLLARLPEPGRGTFKRRPALFLAALPGPYQTVLACGVSTKLHAIRPDWDELIEATDVDFAASGLRQTSVIRLSYLCALHSLDVTGVIGSIDPARLDRLRTRLADQVRP